jgi:uncharacterized membrane protein
MDEAVLLSGIFLQFAIVCVFSCKRKQKAAVGNASGVVAR